MLSGFQTSLNLNPTIRFEYHFRFDWWRVHFLDRCYGWGRKYKKLKLILLLIWKHVYYR